jgi:hypothetical protein
MLSHQQNLAFKQLGRRAQSNNRVKPHLLVRRGKVSSLSGFVDPPRLMHSRPQSIDKNKFPIAFVKTENRLR